LIYALAFTTLAAVPSITLAAAAASTTFAVPSVATAAAAAASTSAAPAAAAAASAGAAPSPSGLLLGRPAARRRDAAVVARVQRLGHAVAGRHGCLLLTATAVTCQQAFFAAANCSSLLPRCN
jgi:hypothetical protein